MIDMEGDFIKINEWLLPLSWLYGLGVRFRNALFEMGILKQRSYSLPVISVGNITVGGAGKTPHVEYLVRLLHGMARVAVLSRGYKRKSRGYVLANDRSRMEDIGDEPYQMKQKFDNIYVAVDKKRTEGIARLTHDEETKDVDVILLDDAFQHRYVKPGINILLVDYHRLIISDKLLPAGRLREPLEGKRRADVVIITKCPPDLKPMEIRVLTKAMGLYPYQDLYFTTLQYQPLKPYYNISDKQSGKALTLDDIHGYNVLLLTGIASPKQILTDLTPSGSDALWRPPQLQAARHCGHQPAVRLHAESQGHRHHREGRRASAGCRRTERRGQGQHLCAAHPDQVHAGPGGAIQPESHQLREEELKKQHLGEAQGRQRLSQPPPFQQQATNHQLQIIHHFNSQS